MNRRWSVLLVTLLGLGAVWGLTTLSLPPTHLVNTPAIAASPQEIITPDLTKVDAKAFLDPPTLGEKAPDFTLMDVSTHKPFRLSSLHGKKNAVLVFYQGSFCPVCGHQLENIQRHLSDFQKQNAEIIAISADPLKEAEKTIGEHGLSFHVLIDPKKDVIQKYGVANIVKHGIAWPSSFVVDKRGVVKLSVADPEGKRLHSDTLLQALSQLTGVKAPELSYEE